MNEIKTVDSLYEALRLDGIETVSELEKEFARIAGALINDFAIRKADKLYRFVEIEFYHSMADRSEGCDGVTYPRVGDALQYFFHKSGMDLTFLSDAERYGGILIRAIRCGDEFINGPYKVVDKLFDQFDARNLPSGNYPLIVAAELEERVIPVPSWRHHIAASDKKYRYSLPRDKWTGHKDYQAYPWDYKGNLKKK